MSYCYEKKTSVVIFVCVGIISIENAIKKIRYGSQFSASGLISVY